MAVAGACEILGIDPLYVACEGRLVASSPPGGGGGARRPSAHPLGADVAPRWASIRADPPGLVLLETSFGGTRIVDMLVGDPLPRIC